MPIKHARAPEKIISGGQTGVDQAALDWAIKNSLPHGGWCPAGRKAADGRLDAKYQLTETESESYSQRTRRNVAESDGTLIVYMGELEGGSQLTSKFARTLTKPYLTVQLDGDNLSTAIQQLHEWLQSQHILVLNIAGPSEGRCPGIYGRALSLMDALWH